MSPVSHGIDRKLGSHLSFNMSTIVTMERIGGEIGAINIRDWGRLTLHFLIANNTVNESEFKIRGGEELKITVEITPYKVLPVNAVALEQTIIQSLEGTIVDSDYSNGQLAVTWDDEDVGSACDPSHVPSLRFEGEKGEVMGYYSWACTAEETMLNGSTSIVQVGSSAHSENGSVTLFLAYPLSINVGNIEHDPSVGVVRENAPAMIIDRIKEETGDPAFYLLGIVMAVTVVFVTLRQGGRKRSVDGKAKGKIPGPQDIEKGEYGDGPDMNARYGPGTEASFMNPTDNGSFNGHGAASNGKDIAHGNGSFNGNETLNGNGRYNGNGTMNGFRFPTGDELINGNGDRLPHTEGMHDSFAPKEKV